SCRPAANDCTSQAHLPDDGNESLVQMRWKISSPRTLTGRPFGPAYVAIHLVATVVGLTKRPDPSPVLLRCCTRAERTCSALTQLRQIRAKSRHCALSFDYFVSTQQK